MKFILPGSLTVAATLLISAMPAAAQEAELKVLALQSAVNDIIAGKAIRTEIADLDQDGFMEAMLVYENETTVAGQLFSIVDELESGEYAEVGFQYGASPTLISDGTVIDANGVYFNWTGFALLPYFDTYETLQFYNGDAQDRLEILEIDPWMNNLRHYDIQIANIDLFGDEEPERFAWLDGSEYAISQTTPYYVFDSEGKIVTSGAFLDRPYIFNLADRKAAAIITHNGAGFETKILE